MTTSEPRVRVSHVPWENFAYPWVRQCDGCQERTGYWLDQPAAVEDAQIHAMECPALRLAALLRELERLRDGWTSRALYVDGSLLPPVSVKRRIYQRAAADLTAVLARAAGGTG